MYCHLQFPRTVTVYSFTSNNMILFKTRPTASIKSIVLQPHSGSVVGRREGYLHCVVHYINPRWEQTLPHNFRNQSTIIIKGKLITATKYPTMVCHLSHTIWPQHKHQALLHYDHEHKLLTYPSNANRVIIHTSHDNGNEKNVYNKLKQTNINLKMFVLGMWQHTVWQIGSHLLKEVAASVFTAQHHVPLLWEPHISLYNLNLTMTENTMSKVTFILCLCQ
jgi:hypothetical protein